MSARVTPAGGAVAAPKTAIGNSFDFFAHFIDSKGNRVGLHSKAQDVLARHNELNEFD